MPETPPIPLIRPAGPLLVFGGAYSNLQATRTLRGEADRLGIPAADVVCTGDAVAYGADPAATVDLVRDWGCTVIAGNVEEQLGAGADDCGCGFAEGTACDALSARWYRHADAAMTPDRRAWMRDLPLRAVVEMAGRRLAVLHGGASSINRFLFPSAADDDLRAELDLAAAQVGGCDGVLAGHSGIPFTRFLPDGRLWHNSGALGMPADDGTPRTWYSLLTATSDGIRIDHRPLTYDWQAARDAMHAARLPAGYADALGSGMWPGIDVLPPTERQGRGIPRNPGAMLRPR